MPGAEFHVVHGDTLEAAALRRSAAAPALASLLGASPPTLASGTPLRDQASGRAPGACCQTKRRPKSGEALDVLHINIRSFVSHAAELNALIQLRKSPPAIVSVNETWLDRSTQQVELEGYELVARRDRQEGQDDRKCGGVMVFARADIANSVTLLEKSIAAERDVVGRAHRSGALLALHMASPA